MKRLLFLTAVAILVIPFSSLMSRPAYGQDGGFGGDTVDLTNLLNGGGNNNGNRGNNNRGPQIPDSKLMYEEIQATLKKGKTPLEDAQKKPLQNLINTEVVALTDKIQLLRNNNGNNNNFPANNNNAPAANTTAARGGQPNQPNNAQNNPQQPSAQAIQIDTITALKNDDFLNTKLSGFLTPEQIALVQKTHAEDKKNETCLGGLLDRYYNQLQNNGRGNNNNNNQNYNNNNNNNNNNQNQTRPNGQKYCMTQTATPAERLEPIRKVLAKGNMPLAADKNTFAEVFMKAQLQDLETALRAGLTNNNQGRGNNNNRNNNPQQIIQSSIDGIYKKVEAQLKPEQADVLKMWHYTQMLDRSPIDALIAVNAMQDTPLSDEQIAKVTAAWPELQRQVEDAARAAKKQITQKQREGAAMTKILEMLDPPQVVSYQLAKKYGPEAVSGK